MLTIEYQADYARRRRTGVYEIKHDDFRFICRRKGDRVRVFYRRVHASTDRVPLIAEACSMAR
jgi:ATP-dependent DNA ligase